MYYITRAQLLSCWVEKIPSSPLRLPLAYHGMFDQFVSLFTSISLKQYKLAELDAV